MSEQTPPRLDDGNFEKLAEHIQALLEQVEALPFPKVQEDTYELLNCLDLLHREALTRLVEMIETKAPQLKLEMANDFAIQTLMMLYNFVPDERPLVTAPVRSGMGTSTFIPLDQIGVAPTIKMPIWIPGGEVDNLRLGTIQRKDFDGVTVLLCRVNDEIYAMSNHCLDSILPLDRGKLDGYLLHCPWHGCQYDVRTGEIQNGSGLALKIYPVLIEGASFRIGFNIPEHMR